MAGSDLALKVANHHAIVLNYINATLERPTGRLQPSRVGEQRTFWGLGACTFCTLAEAMGRTEARDMVMAGMLAVLI